MLCRRGCYNEPAGAGGVGSENSSSLAIEISITAGIPQGKKVMVPAMAPANAIAHRLFLKADTPPTIPSMPTSAKNIPIEVYNTVINTNNDWGGLDE